jgi:hypothetical protein
MYKQLWNGIENKVSTAMVLRLEDSTYIPTDPANTDYQDYLKWLEKGNEPLPAE